MRARRVAVLGLALLLTAGTAACSGGGDDSPGPSDPTGTASSSAAVIKPAHLTFAVYGAPAEVAAYQSAVDAYDAAHREAKVKLATYDSREALVAALDAGDVPDLYLLDRTDLADVHDRKLNRPVGDLMDARDVDLGEAFSRPATESFALDRQLQCMPYGISPTVVYYNKALVDFPRMAAKGIDVPNVDDADPKAKLSWSFEQFEAAAQFASRPRKGIAGLYVSPTLRGLAPFVYSAGGDLYNDDTTPTSLAFSSDDTRSALRRVLPPLTDPRENLTAEQLAQKTPLEWFEQGKLAMIAGDRSLTPELRSTPGLDFDVMPMPVVDDAATVGELTGLCISSKTRESAAAADFMADFVSAETTSAVAQAGYLSPANVQVALTDAFLQPGQLPVHASVFYDSERNIRIAPLLPDPSALDNAVADPVAQLLATEIPDLDLLTSQIDLESQAVLTPPSTESPSPSETPSSD